MYKSICLLLAIILVGCSGEDNNNPSSSSSSSSSSARSASSVSSVSSSNNSQLNSHFSEVPNAFNFLVPYPVITLQKPAIIDINGDGRDDIVLFGQGPLFLASANSSCLSFLYVYVMQSDNTFVDETSRYVDTSSLDGCLSKYNIADINNDGKKDIVFTTNREDGRSTIDPTVMNSQLTGLISGSYMYTLVKFGIPNWYCAVGIGYDNNNKPFVTGNGYTNSTSNMIYYFNNQTPSTTTTYPIYDNRFTVNQFEFFSSHNTNNTYTDLLVTNDGGNYTIQGYQQKSDGHWVSTGSVDLAPLVMILKKTIGWTGDYFYNLPVSKYKNHNISIGSPESTCRMKIYPNGDDIVVFRSYGQILPDNIDENTILNQTDYYSYPVNFFRAVTIKNGITQEVQLNIDNEQDTYRGNYMDCFDVNNDGYDDIIMYPFTNDGLPFIYLNNKNGGFNYYGKNNLPSTSNIQWQSDKYNDLYNYNSSIIHDFNHDGFTDILVFPANYGLNTSWINLRLFMGQKIL